MTPIDAIGPQSKEQAARVQPFDVDSYRSELPGLASHLEHFATHVSIRGEGPAQFLYGESRKDSVDISWNEHLQVLPVQRIVSTLAHCVHRPRGCPERFDPHQATRKAVVGALAELE